MNAIGGTGTLLDGPPKQRDPHRRPSVVDPPTPSRTALLRTLAPGAGSGLLMLAVGAVAAGRPVLSGDEATTADVAQRSFGQIIDLAHTVDAVIAPYYLLLHAWTLLAGDSVTALRAPSILAMAAAVGLTGELGRRLFNPLTGGLAGVLLCLVPNTSRYAAEARPYAFTCLFSVLAILTLHAALRRPHPARWTGYAVAVLLLGLTHATTLSSLGAHAVAVAFAWRQGRSWRLPAAWAAAVAAVLLALAPLLLLGRGQRDTQLFWVEPISTGRLLAAPAGIVGAATTAWLLIGLGLLAAGHRRDRTVETAALLLFPPAALAAASLLTEPLWVPRYLLICLAPLTLLAAAAIAGPARPGPGRLLRVGLILAVVAATAYPAQRAVRGNAAKSGGDYRSAGQLISGNALPGDAILYHDRSRALRSGVEYYHRDAPHPPRDVMARRTPAQAGALRADEHPDAAAPLAGVRRAWLVVNGAPADPAAHKAAARAVLRAEFQQVSVWRYRGVTVALYVRR